MIADKTMRNMTNVVVPSPKPHQVSLDGRVSLDKREQWQKRKLEDISISRKNRKRNQEQEEKDFKRIQSQPHNYETIETFRGSCYKITSYRNSPKQLIQLNIYCFNEYYDSVKPYFVCKHNNRYRLFQEIFPLVFKEIYDNGDGFPIKVGETPTKYTDDMIDKVLGDVVSTDAAVFLFDIHYENVYHNEFYIAERLGWQDL
jgi:hypothetical protein